MTYTTPTDSVPGAFVSCVPSAGAFAVGDTVVTCSGSVMSPMCVFDPITCPLPTPIPMPTGSSTFTVHVIEDTVAPTIAAKARVKATSAVVTYDLPAVTDNAPDPSAATCTPASGSTFPSGVSTVACFAADRFGRIGTSSFEVEVPTPVGTTPVDTTAPNALVAPGYAGTMRLAKLARPLAFKAMCSEDCTLVAELTVAPKAVKRQGAKPVVLATTTATLPAGTVQSLKVAVPAAGRTLLRTKPTTASVPVTLRVTVRDGAGNERTAFTGVVRLGLT